MCYSETKNHIIQFWRMLSPRRLISGIFRHNRIYDSVKLKQAFLVHFNPLSRFVIDGIQSKMDMLVARQPIIVKLMKSKYYLVIAEVVNNLESDIKVSVIG